MGAGHKAPRYELIQVTRAVAPRFILGMGAGHKAPRYELTSEGNREKNSCSAEACPRHSGGVQDPTLRIDWGGG